MEHYYLSNGTVGKYDTDQSALYAVQYLRTRGNKVVATKKYLNALDFHYAVLFGHESSLTASQIEELCYTLLTEGGYSSTATHIVELRYDANRNLSLRVVETSPYKHFTIRALRPKGYIFPITCHELTIQSSAWVAMRELMRQLSRAYDCDIPICVNSDNNIWSVDGVSPFVVTGRNIYVNPTITSVEAMMVYDALKELKQYVIIPTEISLNELLHADELFYVDHRGITSVHSVSKQLFSDNVANMVSNLLNNEI